MNKGILLENGYREWEVDLFHKNAKAMYQKRFRNEKGQTKYFITIYEYEHEDKMNYEVQLQFEQDKYIMNITLFGIQDMTIEDIEREVYAIWYGLDCKYYED